MPVHELGVAARRLATATGCRPTRLAGCARNASTATTANTSELQDLEGSSSLATSFSSSQTQSFDPVAQSQKRKGQLPPSRYQFRPPKYYRGPLHPHQPPKPSDPASREFVPGPFSLPRLQQTYESTIASDLMALSYQHHPPGFEPAVKAPRLRQWDESSPYHKNRPLRAPRGSDVLNLLRRPITFRNLPKLDGVTVHAFVREATEDSAALHVASMVIQAITGQRCTAHAARSNVQNWGLRAGKYVAVSVDLRGEEMYHFLGKLIDVVMPRIRDWRGVKGSSGDDNGNISFGFKPDVVALFPEVEVNYDSYPPKMIPGCRKSWLNGEVGR